MPLGRKRSVLISLCKYLYFGRALEGVKTIVPYELVRDFKTIFTGSNQQCIFGEARILYHRNGLKPKPEGI